MHDRCARCGKRVDLDYGEGRLCLDCAADRRRSHGWVFLNVVDAACLFIVLLACGAAALVWAGWI